MARQLRVLAAALTEDPGSILSIHTVIPVPEDPTLSSGLLRHCTYGMHIHTCRQNAHILFWGVGGSETVSLCPSGCPDYNTLYRGGRLALNSETC